MKDNSIDRKEKKFSDIIKLGRTHLQDATPIGLHQEFSGYKELLIKSRNRFNNIHSTLQRLAQGGTAVGTGINTNINFGKEIASEISIIQDIIEAKPTDGLWEDNRNDEKQLGMTYKQIEEAMNNKERNGYLNLLQVN